MPTTVFEFLAELTGAPFWFDAAAKATVLLLAAVAATALLQRSSAALRHRLWCLTFAALVLLPGLSAALPKWRLAILPHRRPLVSRAESIPLAVQLERPAEPARQELAGPPGPQTALPLAEQGVFEAPLRGETAQAEAAAHSPPNLAVFWLIGALVALSPLVAGVARTRLLRRQAKPIDAFVWTSLLDELRERLGLARRVGLYETDSALVPMTWGVLRPVVLLPRQAREWTGRLRRFVLLHELAHVKRCDVGFQMLGRLACALYWFHPLAWYALRRLRIERELACDDCAVLAGERATDYAAELLHIARSYRHVPFAAAVAMAQRGNLERRLCAMFDRARSHLPLSARAARLLLAGVLVLVTAVAVIRPAPRVNAQDDKPDDAAKETGVGPPDTPKSSAESEQVIVVRGRVLDPDGKPFAGATVYLREAAVGWTGTEHHPTPTRNLAQTTTDADGQFEVRDVEVAGRVDWREFLFPLDLIAWAPNYGLAWRHVAAPPHEPLDLKLSVERTIRGRLVESDGKPAARVFVKVREIGALDHPVYPNLLSPDHVDLKWSEVPLSVLTDAKGKFAFGGLPRSVRATLWIRDDRYVAQDIYAATSDEPLPDLIDDYHKVDSIRVHTRAFLAKITRAYRVLGRVVFADSGRRAIGAGWCEPPVLGPPDRLIGPDGRFTFSRLRPGHLYFEITPPFDSGYLGIATTVEVAGEAHDIEQTIELPRGEIVTGRVIDDVTGRGVGGATIYYQPEQVGQQNPRRFAWNVKSRDDGRFRIAVPPGKGELILAGSVEGYLTHDRSGLVSDAPAKFHRTIEVQPGRASAEVEFAISPGIEVRGRVVDPEGNPVEAAQIEVQRFEENSRWPRVKLSSDHDGRFVLRGLLPTSQYEIRCQVRSQGLVGMATLPNALGVHEAIVTIKLAKTGAVTGQIMRDALQPLPGAIVRLWRVRHLSSGVCDEPASTDDDGRFRFDGLWPEEIYYVNAVAEVHLEQHSPHFTVADGETHELGAATLVAADLDVVGVILDAQGRPAKGARVYGTVNRVGTLGIHSETRLTDAEGHFRLFGFPRGMVDVWLERDNSDRRGTIRLGKVEAGVLNARLVVEGP